MQLSYLRDGVLFSPNGVWRNICECQRTELPYVLILIGILVLIEGAITIALGIAGFFLLPGPAEKTKFLNEREKMIAIERLNSNEDDGSAAVSAQ